MNLDEKMRIFSNVLMAKRVYDVKCDICGTVFVVNFKNVYREEYITCPLCENTFKLKRPEKYPDGFVENTIKTILRTVKLLEWDKYFEEYDVVSIYKHFSEMKGFMDAFYNSLINITESYHKD